MTLWRSRTALNLSVSALAGLTSPLTLVVIFLGLGSTETVLAERTIHRFAISHSGVQFIFDAVVPCIDAIVCGAVFGIPLGILVKGQFLKCWAVFMVGAVTAHTVAAFLVPSPFGGFSAGLWLIISLPFWWLFPVVLLGFMGLAARLRTGVGMWPNNRWRGP